MGTSTAYHISKPPVPSSGEKKNREGKIQGYVYDNGIDELKKKKDTTALLSADKVTKTRCLRSSWGGFPTISVSSCHSFYLCSCLAPFAFPIIPTRGKICLTMDSPSQSYRLFGAQRSLHDLLGGGTGEFDAVLNRSWLCCLLLHLHEVVCILHFRIQWLVNNFCGRSGRCDVVEEEEGGCQVAGSGDCILDSLLLRAWLHTALLRVPGAYDPAHGPLRLGQGCTVAKQVILVWSLITHSRDLLG